MNDLSDIASQIQAACDDWMTYKQQEAMAREARLEIEALIDTLLGHREEGAETHEVGPYKLTITGKLTRTWDMTQLEALLPGIPEALRPVRSKLEVDTRGIKWLENNEPEIYEVLTQALVVKPAKTEIKVEVRRP